MKRAMILAFAAAALMLFNPSPGFALGTQSQGSSSQGMSSRGPSLQGAKPSGTFSGGNYGRGGSAGGYSHGGYRPGMYPDGGHRPGNWRYPYWRYPRRTDVYFGGVWIEPGWGPWWWGPVWPYYYPYYYPYYSAPPVVIEQGPTEYIEKGDEAEEPDYMYYCRKPEGYYPRVQRCPSGWMKVAPSEVPPDQQEE